MKTLSLGEARIQYLDTGQGSGVVLGHCSSASHREWSFLVPSLARRYRVLVPDLLGYGRSSAWPLVGSEPLTRDVDVLEALLEQVSGPVHLVGHSYGAAMWLEVARRSAQRGDGKILSLFLIEPVSFHLLRDAGHREWQTVQRLADRILERSAKGDHSGAAAAFMGFWLGPTRWWLSPRKFRARVARTMPKVAAEFQQLFEQPATLVDHGSIECPVTLMHGSASPHVAVAVVELLASSLKDVRVVELAGAGHMSPFTHPEQVATLVEAHLARAPRAHGHRRHDECTLRACG